MEQSAALVPHRVSMGTESFPAVPARGLALPPFLLCSAEMEMPDSNTGSAQGEGSTGSSPVTK